MAFFSASRFAVLVALLVSILFQALSAAAESSASPAPSPVSDGTTLDQGIAYVLMFAALLVTYIVHPVGSFPFNLF
ncbi:hypothetical protein KP509_05G029200 [Ceratopteris richardii]|uniref:Uncharacterized protein n=1 Tax=Ceratopteris richardii TaxID=49495 RepID=A0A8T2UPE6_CERRI|nr:hypothetical protein KP509_05G029200 [Ceratopteris richardii]